MPDSLTSVRSRIAALLHVGTKRLQVDPFDTWLRQGMEAGWCGPPVCQTHDGIPTSAAEDEEWETTDPCLHIIRLYEDATVKAAVEANHSPSIWRATNRA